MIINIVLEKKYLGEDVWFKESTGFLPGDPMGVVYEYFWQDGILYYNLKFLTSCQVLKYAHLVCVGQGFVEEGHVQTDK